MSDDSTALAEPQILKINVTVEETSTCQRKVKVSKNGFFAFGIGKDRKLDVVITENKDGKITKIVKKILLTKKNLPFLSLLCNSHHHDFLQSRRQ